VSVAPESFFVYGGTLKPSVPSYIERPADAEFFRSLNAGEFCFVLTARQMGKSSLMARVAAKLRKDGWRLAILDLSVLTETSKARSPGYAAIWYYGICRRVATELEVASEFENWWAARDQLSEVQRFSEFLSEYLISHSAVRIVIFIDEIDTTLNLPFTDDFFASIRGFYNARATHPQFERLTFALLGVASPSDLIKDAKRTPFNIGRRIDLDDFTFDEAKKLGAGFRCNDLTSIRIIERILYWTSGQPYLTQKLCLEAALLCEQQGDCESFGWSHEVDQLVDEHFCSPRASRDEVHFKYIRDRLSEDPRREHVLKEYLRIYRGQHVHDLPQSVFHTSLKLAGLVRRDESGSLRTRNRIYEKVFTPEWAKDALPINWSRRIAGASVAVLVCAASLWFFVLVPRTFHSLTTAATENNLGRALYQQGLESDPAKSAELFSEAGSAFRRALAVSRREQLPQQWAQTQNNLGSALKEQGIRTEGAQGTELLAQAVAAYRSALEVYTREQLPQQWAQSQNNLGSALKEQGIRIGGARGTELLAQAVAAYRSALEVYSREQLPQQWAQTQNNLGQALQELGTRSEGAKATELLEHAVVAYRSALEVTTPEQLPQDWATTQNNLGQALKELALRDPTNTQWPSDLATSYERIGDVQSAQGDFKAALSSYQKSLKFRETLAARDPTNTQWPSDLATSYERIGDVQSAQGDLKTALSSYQKSLELRETLAARDPTNTQWRRDLAYSYERIGDVQRAQGDFKAALNSHQKSLELRETLAARDPTNTQWRRDLAYSYERIGDVQRDQGDFKAALSSYQKSLELRETLAARDPTNTQCRSDLAYSYERIGYVQSAQGDLKAALSSYQKSLELRETLAARDPTNTQWRGNLAYSYERLGDIFRGQGNLKAALSSYQKSLELRETLAARDPTNTQWRTELANSHERLGELFRAQGEYDNALRDFTEAIRLDPNNALAYENRGAVYVRTGNIAKANADFETARRLKADQ
jgi:tetratricopeptide (TPR) repeat protein